MSDGLTTEATFWKVTMAKGPPIIRAAAHKPEAMYAAEVAYLQFHGQPTEAVAAVPANPFEAEEYATEVDIALADGSLKDPSDLSVLTAQAIREAQVQPSLEAEVHREPIPRPPLADMSTLGAAGEFFGVLAVALLFGLAPKILFHVGYVVLWGGWPFGLLAYVAWFGVALVATAYTVLLSWTIFRDRILDAARLRSRSDATWGSYRIKS